MTILRLVAVTAVLALTAACTPAEQATKPPPPSLSNYGPVVAGGCGATRVFGGTNPPSWALEGFNGPVSVPWAVSESGKALAYLFARQLVAGGVRTDGSANKVLWVIKDPGTPSITAHPAGANSPRLDIAGQGTNGNQMPTIVDLPVPGCWVFDLAWGRTTRDRISLQALPEGSLPA